MNRIIIIFIFSLIVTYASHAQQVNKSDLSNLLKNVNTRYDEQNPILSSDGKKLYFSRSNDSLNIGGSGDKGDIWVSDLSTDGIWIKPENLGKPVNNDLKNYILGFSPDGNIMFLNLEKKLPGGVVVNDGIAFSLFSKKTWSKPERVLVDYLMNNSKHQSGSISADGSLMLLSLQSFASRGEEDIYISSYQNGKWTKPVNLGSDINTPGQEMTPYLSADKKFLYFSSNGHGGKGGRDLYVSERKNKNWNSWSKPKNLGLTVNSEGVELNYHIDSNNLIAYYSSTQNSDGYGDLKAYDITVDIKQDSIKNEEFKELIVIAEEVQKTIHFSGIIINKKTGKPILASLSIDINGVEEKYFTEENEGIFKFELPSNLSEVIINIKAQGYMGLSEELTLNGKNLNINYDLDPLEIGSTIRLNKVYFERSTAVLLNESFDEIDLVTEMMKENPFIKIELSGHTDNNGNSKLNLKLSQDRVEKVKKYLVEHGIDSKRIKGKGYGGTKPVASNAAEETRKLNRRVEFTILKN